MTSVPALLVVAAVRIAGKWRPVRIVPLFSSRIGHFVADPEILLSEQALAGDAKVSRRIELFYHAAKPVANQQMAIMLRRRAIFLPAWLLGNAAKWNRIIPGGEGLVAPSETFDSRDRDGFLSRTPPQLSFTNAEEEKGRSILRGMGVPDGAPFVCVIGRDSAYLRRHQPSKDYSYHAYRNVDIQTFALAAESLAERGCYVFRMGSEVEAVMNSSHPRVIDYAGRGMRSDFMDAYLGARCLFCISVGTGFDNIPMAFRRPIAFVNYVPAAYLSTFLANSIFLLKNHRFASDKRPMTLAEIFRAGVGSCLTTACYESAGVELVDNTPEEIEAAAVEMYERITGAWVDQPGDEERQRRFWELYPLDAREPFHGRPLHGEVRGRYSATYLREHPEFLN